MTSSPSRLNHAPSDGDTRSEQPIATITYNILFITLKQIFYRCTPSYEVIMSMSKQTVELQTSKNKALQFGALTFHMNDEVVLLLLVLRWCGRCEYNVQQVWLWDVDTTQSAILFRSSTDADVLSRRLVNDVTVRHVTALSILLLGSWRKRLDAVICENSATLESNPVQDFMQWFESFLIEMKDVSRSQVIIYFQK